MTVDRGMIPHLRSTPYPCRYHSLARKVHGMSTQQNHTEAVALKVLRDHADAYYLQGSGLVERADVLWEQSKDPDRDEVERAAARHEYLVVSARAQSKFKRHDVLLDVVARREALRDL